MELYGDVSMFLGFIPSGLHSCMSRSEILPPLLHGRELVDYSE
jgi:hypothetical protein